MGGPHQKPDSTLNPSDPPRARVVLLRSKGSQVPQELRDALARNNAEPVEVDHAFAAMAHLTTIQPAVLLLCEPDQLEASSELLAAVERYLPRATRWEYVPGQTPPLRPIDSPGEKPSSNAAANGSASTPVTTKPEIASSFALRLSSDPLSGKPPSSVGDILTRDEMEALFSEDPR